MSNPNPPSGGDNSNWTPQPPSQPHQPQPYPPQPAYPQQPYPQQQYGQPPQPYQQPHQPAPSAPQRQMPQVNMQSVNQLIRSVPQLVRVLRMLAWAELIVLVLFGLISFCSSFGTFGGFYSLGISAVTSLLVTVLEAFVFWGLLMGLALLLENQTGSRGA